MSAKRKAKVQRSSEFLSALRLVEREVNWLKQDWQRLEYLALRGCSDLSRTYFDQLTAANQILVAIRSLK